MLEAGIVLERINRSGANAACHARWTRGASCSDTKRGARTTVVPRAGRGSARLQSFAVTESDASSDTTGIMTFAKHCSDRYVGPRHRVFTSHVQHLDLLMPLAGTTRPSAWAKGRRICPSSWSTCMALEAPCSSPSSRATASAAPVAVQLTGSPSATLRAVESSIATVASADEGHLPLPRFRDFRRRLATLPSEISATLGAHAYGCWRMCAIAAMETFTLGTLAGLHTPPLLRAQIGRLSQFLILLPLRSINAVRTDALN
jgi:hypothetical protein